MHVTPSAPTGAGGVFLFESGMKRIDLHIHTHASDGHFSPTEVVQMAASGRLDIIAVTDHDTVAGVDEALAAAALSGVRVVPGIEMSTREGDHEIHLLGYFVDHHAPSIANHASEAGERRMERMRQMVRNLQGMGVAIDFEDVIRAAGPEASSIGRPHLARALLERGQTRYYGEAFDRYIGDHGSAFVRSDFPRVFEAIDAVHAAGGVAVWAHPEMAVFDAHIRTFVEWGLDGIECYRPNTPPVESHLFETVAASMGLVRTGGSDFHGTHRMHLGDFAVKYDDVREMLDARLPV
jgi:predicted metal-dependent phosphoesterase TrpH